MEQYIQFTHQIDYPVTEGCLIPEQAAYFCELIKHFPNIRNVIEVGFNGGHSSAAFLASHPDVKVVSFDLGEWDYVLKAKRVIDRMFPGRHSLVIGDSVKTVPLMLETMQPAPGSFQLAFVDGGHVDPVPFEDMRNFLQVLPSGGIIILDDFCEAYGHQGVIKGWEQCLEMKLIAPVAGPYTIRDRGWIVGQKL